MMLRLQLRRWIGTAGVLVLALCVAVAPVSATVLKLSTQTTVGSVEGLRISSNNQWVVYRVIGAQYVELWSVPITGGTPVRLTSFTGYNPNPSFGGPVWYFISPDSQRVVYLGIPASLPPNNLANYGLWSVPIDGSGPSVRLNGPYSASQGVTTFGPTSQFVIYRADETTNEVYELFSAPIDGSSPAVKLNKSLPTEGDVTTDFRVTPDGARVVYTADQDFDGVNELYSVPIAGPASSGVKLHGSLSNNGDVGFPPGFASPFEISADSSRVVYYADQEVDGQYELFSALINGSGSNVKLNASLGAGEYVYPGAYQVSTDGQKVVYVVNRNAGRDVYSVPITGPIGANVKLDDETLLAGQEPVVAFFAQGDTRVIYATGGNANVYSVSSNGPASASVQILAGVTTYFITPSRTHIVSYSGPSVGGSLSSVPVTGSLADVVQLANSTVGGPLGVTVSPDNSRVIYIDTASELWSVPLRGPVGAAVKISGPMVTGGGVRYYSGWAISSDSTRVVYRADQEVLNRIDLYVTDEGNLLNNKVYLPLVLR